MPSPLVESKRGRALDDPSCSRPIPSLLPRFGGVVRADVQALTAQLATIIADGVEAGEFEVADTESAARAAFDGTARFHNPANAGAWSDPGSRPPTRACGRWSSPASRVALERPVPPPTSLPYLLTSLKAWLRVSVRAQ